MDERRKRRTKMLCVKVRRNDWRRMGETSEEDIRRFDWEWMRTRLLCFKAEDPHYWIHSRRKSFERIVAQSIRILAVGVQRWRGLTGAMGCARVRWGSGIMGRLSSAVCSDEFVAQTYDVGWVCQQRPSERTDDGLRVSQWWYECVARKVYY